MLQLENELQANGYNATATGENPIVVTFGAPSNRIYKIESDGSIKVISNEVIANRPWDGRIYRAV